MSKSFVKMLILILMILSILLLIFFLFFFDMIINSKIKKEALLTEDNYKLWAIIPGKSKAKIYRDNYFYNITDKNNFMKDLYNPKSIPKLNELNPYRIQEKDEWINRKYIKDTSEVEFNYYKYLSNVSGEELKRQNNDVLQSINVPALGVWLGAKSIPRQNIALTALYTIYNGLLTDFYYSFYQTVLNMSIKSLDKFKEIFRFNYIDNISDLYNNEDYGFISRTGFFVKAILKKHYYQDDKDYTYLKEFFQISDFELLICKEQLEKIFIENINISEFDNSIKKDCSPENVAASQWLYSNIASGSIKNKNSTISGYVEYSEYLKNVKKTNYKTTLNIDLVKKLFTFNKFGFNKKEKKDDKNSILLKKNMDTIMKQNSCKVSSIDALMKSCNINNHEEASNIIDYLDYISTDIALLTKKVKSKELAKQYAAISTLINQAFHPTIFKIGSLLFNHILKKKLYSFLLVDNSNCITIIKKYLQDFIKDIDIEKLCSNEYTKIDKEDNIFKLWIPGILGRDKKLQYALHFNDYEFELITQFDSTIVKDFSKVMNELQIELNIKKSTYLTADLLKLGIKQFVNNNKDEKNKDILSKKYLGVDSVYNLIDFDGSKPFKVVPEFYWFVKNNDMTLSLSETDFLNKLNFNNGLFSLNYIQTLFIQYYNKDINKKEIFANKEFISYLKHLVIEEVLGGIIIKKSVGEFMWGFESDILNRIKNSNYFTGGDPTLETNFHYLTNMKKEESNDPNNRWRVKSGIDNINQVRQYTRAYGNSKSIVAQKMPYFTGEINDNGEYVIEKKYISPWNIDLFLNGTDSISFKPLTDKLFKPWMFIDDIFRTGNFNFFKIKKYNGLNTHRFVIDNSLLEKNKEYFMEKYRGFGNNTSVLKAPIFISKPYYKDTDNNDSKVSKAIINFPYKSHDKTNDNDDIDLYEESWFDIEPRSGAVLRAGQKIMASALIEPDVLFDVPKAIFIPVNYVFRSCNLTQEGIDSFLGDLKIAFSIKYYCIITFSVLSFIFIIVLLYILLRKQPSILIDDKNSINSDTLIKINQFENNKT